MKSAIVILLLLSHTVLAGTPTEALKAFQKALTDQKFDDAWTRTAQFEGSSKEVTLYLESRVKRILKLSAKGWGFEILEEKIIGDCAVIVTKETRKGGKKGFDLDPVYMIKQGANWKVMPNITQWDLSKRIPADKQPASMKLDQIKIAAYKKLEAWFDDHKAKIRKKRNQKEAQSERNAIRKKRYAPIGGDSCAMTLGEEYEAPRLARNAT